VPLVGPWKGMFSLLMRGGARLSFGGNKRGCVMAHTVVSVCPISCVWEEGGPLGESFSKEDWFVAGGFAARGFHCFPGLIELAPGLCDAGILRYDAWLLGSAVLHPNAVRAPACA